MALPIWERLLTQLVCFAAFLARENTGNMMAARIAMIAITTSSSIRVNPAGFCFIQFSMDSIRLGGDAQFRLVSENAKCPIIHIMLIRVQAILGWKVPPAGYSVK